MGLLGKLFDKKYCSVCGNEIKFLGNRKLEDGNLCKDCAGKLSPFFSDRRKSTVEEIREQLAYREENRKAVEAFRVTRVLGTYQKLILDEDNGKFMVTRARNYAEANPDVLDASQITGWETQVSEGRSEEKTRDADDKPVSYNPPRFTFYYHFHVTIYVNHPYFDTIRFDLNPSRVVINEDNPLPLNRKPNPRLSQTYRQYETLAREMENALSDLRARAREAAAAAAAPKPPRSCPFCGATTVPDENGCCEYCGSRLDAE